MNHYQASAFQVSTKDGKRTVRELSDYPVIPAGYPNRAVRRTLARGRVDLLPTAWREFVTNLRVQGLVH